MLRHTQETMERANHLTNLTFTDKLPSYYTSTLGREANQCLKLPRSQKLTPKHRLAT